MHCFLHYQRGGTARVGQGEEAARHMERAVTSLAAWAAGPYPGRCTLEGKSTFRIATFYHRPIRLAVRFDCHTTPKFAFARFLSHFCQTVVIS